MVIRCSIRSSMAAPPSPLAASASRVLHMDQPSAIQRLHISSIAIVTSWGCGPQPQEEWGRGPQPQFVPGGGGGRGGAMEGVVIGGGYRGGHRGGDGGRGSSRVGVSRA